MNAIDTNVFVYDIDRHDRIKRARARNLLRQLHRGPVATILLWQVAGELLRELRARESQGRISRASLRNYVRVIRQMFSLVTPTPAVLDRALDLADRHSLSHWDSMVLGACAEAGVDTLYTEDMGAPTSYDGIRLINPFI